MANLNTSISPAPVVTVRNKDGTTATGYTGNVTMSLGTNPTAATLGGTTVVAATAGVATFNNLTLNRSGADFKLMAVAAAQGGVTPRTTSSSAFDIATSLVFTTQPNTVIAPSQSFSVVVAARDGGGNTDASYNGVITLSLFTDNAATGTLSGSLSATAVSGVATFSGLSINSGGIYELRAEASEVSTAYPPAQVFSNTFYIGQREIEIVPAGENFGINTIFEVEVNASINFLNGQSIDDTSFTENVTISFNTNPVGATLSGTLTKAAVAGVVFFDDLSINKASAGYVLKAASSGYTDAVGEAFSVGIHSVVAGTWVSPADTTNIGYQVNGGSGSSINPGYTINGEILNLFSFNDTTPPTVGTVLQIDGNHVQSAFTSITVGAVTLTSASATHTPGVSTFWQWTGSGNVIFPTVGNYTVTIE